jgi:steroid delta-isomerase-like uncharacterized protein
MSSSNKTIVARLYSEVSQGNLNVIDELASTDLVEHEVTPGIPPTRAGVRQMFEGMRAAFPDFELVADDMIAEGDKVFVRATMRGTQRGDFMGMPASGKKVTATVADFFRISEGKVVEHWGVSDFASVMQQAGAVS